MNGYIVSLKYAPGLAKEFYLLGDNLSRRRWHVAYILSEGYAWITNSSDRDIHYLTQSVSTRSVIRDTLTFPRSGIARLRSLFRRSPPHFLCLYNPHPLNYIVARLARTHYPQGIRAIYLHEPYKPDKHSFGKKGALYFTAVEFMQTLSMKEINCVIVPSPYAYDLFKRKYPGFTGDVHIAPILLPDRQPPTNHQRRYISVVGTINQGRNLDTFIEFINYAAPRSNDIRFQIVTRSQIAAELRRISPIGRQLLSIINKPHISDEEIAKSLDMSYALFLPHTQVTQSGNVPVAFRCGTPIIARNLPGLAQHIRHKENGYLVPYEATPQDLWEAICYVRNNLAHLSHNARASFERTFSEHNWSRYYAWLVDK